MSAAICHGKGSNRKFSTKKFAHDEDATCMHASIELTTVTSWGAFETHSILPCASLKHPTSLSTAADCHRCVRYM